MKRRRAKSPVKTKARSRLSAPGRSQRRAAAKGKAAGGRTPQPTPAAAARLAAEVERLAAELKAARKRIRALEAKIEIDALTETLNRSGFERALRRSLAYVKRYGASAALIYLDLDDFKAVNDRHGHAAGDAVLRAIAAVLQRRVRAADVVARIGGDEFVVLLWNLSEAEAAAKAAALEAAVEATATRWGAATLQVGAAAGAACVRSADTPADVLARADAAMYARKAAKHAARARAAIAHRF